MNKEQLKIVITTFGNAAQASSFVQVMVEKRLVVCAQVDGPIQSFYHWQGKVEQSEEVRVWLKVLSSKLDELEMEFKQQHPYDVPQFLVLNPQRVGSEYFKWSMGV